MECLYRMGRDKTSVGHGIASHLYHGAQDDLRVEPDAPVVDVPQVQVDPGFHHVDGQRFAAVTVDLGPAGDAWFDVLAKRVVADDLLILRVVRSRVGRGPTSDMSPSRTLRSCGSSSIEVLRSHLPTGVTRGSFLRACRMIGPSSSTRIVRNL